MSFTNLFRACKIGFLFVGNLLSECKVLWCWYVDSFVKSDCDVALLMVIVWIINFGSWNFIYYLEFLSASVEIELISFLVVLAAMAINVHLITYLLHGTKFFLRS